jgi:AraC-type DNA-binding domain-containing proteins
MRPYEPGIMKKSEIYFCSPGTKENQDLFFRPLCVGHYFCDKNYKVERTNYDSFLVIYVMEGSLFVKNMNHEKTHIVEHGNFALLDCYHPHCYGTTTGCEILWAHYDGPEARRYFDYMYQSGSLPLPTDSETAYRNLMSLYNVFHENKQMNEPQLSKFIIGILTEFMTGINGTGSSISRKLENVRSYIDDNVKEDLSLEELADYAGLSPFYFSRQFKKKFGMTPYNYVIHSRLGMAQFYLKSTDLTVKEIAYRCGFNDVCNFCTCFKNKLGSTPEQFRNSNHSIDFEKI